ncbi:MAG: Uma2 family endonuclease [Bryobacterales bacterium]|nr:Uma2 family endonuclease [Bryobacterales bacterium]
MVSSSTEYSSLAEVAASEPDAVDYPDRNWTAPSLWHGDAVAMAKSALGHQFRERDDVLVAMELVVYYERGNNRAWLQPDVQVVFGVESVENRETFKVWKEGKAPDFVLEVASPSDAEKGARDQAREYAAIGVREYWRLDPVGTMIAPPLEGYRATGGDHESVELVERTGGVQYLRSRVLGLDLRTERWNGEATVLVIRDPRRGEDFNGSLTQFERRRKIAEDRAIAAQERLTAARERLTAARDEATASKERARAALNRIRAAERRL